MTIITGVLAPFCTELRGKVGHYEDPLPFPYYGIYQQRQCLEGKRTIKMKFYTPTNPQTVPQQANRSKFTDAVIAWQNLTDEQKEVYNSRAVGESMSGYNIKISEYMLS